MKGNELIGQVKGPKLETNTHQRPDTVPSTYRHTPECFDSGREPCARSAASSCWVLGDLGNRIAECICNEHRRRLSGITDREVDHWETGVPASNRPVPDGGNRVGPQFIEYRVQFHRRNGSTPAPAPNPGLQNRYGPQSAQRINRRIGWVIVCRERT